MITIQSIIETIDESRFYLVEHIFENAVIQFCDYIDNAQIDVVNKYIKLIKEGKMSKALETQLSEELEPYLEAYVDIYAPYLFQEITESKNKFDMAGYRTRVGSDIILNLFEEVSAFNVGDQLSTAANTVWGVTDLDGMTTAIDNIIQNTDIRIADIITWVKYVFQSTDNSEAAITQIITTSNKTPEEIKTALHDVKLIADEKTDKFEAELDAATFGDDDDNDDIDPNSTDNTGDT